MKSHLLILITVGWFVVNLGWAAPPFPVPAKGGLPACEAELAECTINLTDTEGLLQVCEDALAQCEATEGQAFPATGQTTCWDSIGAEIPCDGTGQDGDMQAGAELSYTDTGLTIIDNNTKLEWMKQDSNTVNCGNKIYPLTLSRSCRFTWDDAVAFVASLNANNHAGYSDWRVPNMKELLSILNYGKLNPAVSDAFNTGCIQGCTVETCSCTGITRYRSSTTNPQHLPTDLISKWDIAFGSAVVSFHSNNAEYAVRAVRDGL